MKFTIDAHLRSGISDDEQRPFLYNHLRKKDNNQWREVKNDCNIQKGDIVISSLTDMTAYLNYHPIIFSNMEYPTYHEHGLSLSENSAHIYPCVHRKEIPHHFTRNDVADALRTGDDAYTNCLSVLLDGKVKLVRVKEKNPVRDLGFAVSCEFFSQDNDYVGKEAALDKRHVNFSYHVLLDQWVEHLFTGEPNLHSVDPPNETLKRLERKRAFWEYKMKNLTR